MIFLWLPQQKMWSVKIREANYSINWRFQQFNLQYVSFQQFQHENSTKQNEHCLRNFDLSEYRQILSDLAVWIYQGLIKLMESQIHPTIGECRVIFLLGPVYTKPQPQRRVNAVAMLSIQLSLKTIQSPCRVDCKPFLRDSIWVHCFQWEKYL